MFLESLGWFLLGFGVALVILLVPIAIKVYLVRRKFRGFLERVKLSADEFIEEEIAKEEPKKEISELSFRDRNGVLNTVKIIVDHNLNDMHTVDRETLRSLIETGESGTMADLMAGHKITEQAMTRVQEFVFSPRAVRDMRAAGIEPDEAVTRMLKASGRM